MERDCRGVASESHKAEDHLGWHAIDIKQLLGVPSRTPTEGETYNLKGWGEEVRVPSPHLLLTHHHRTRVLRHVAGEANRVSFRRLTERHTSLLELCRRPCGAEAATVEHIIDESTHRRG